MTIKAIRFRDNGFAAQPFVFGGEEGPDKFDPSVRYRSGLTNYLIDTGDEVILVDTGLPAARETLDRVRDFIAPIPRSTSPPTRLWGRRIWRRKP